MRHTLDIGHFRGEGRGHRRFLLWQRDARMRHFQSLEWFIQVKPWLLRPGSSTQILGCSLYVSYHPVSVHVQVPVHMLFHSYTLSLLIHRVTMEKEPTALWSTEACTCTCARFHVYYTIRVAHVEHWQMEALIRNFFTRMGKGLERCLSIVVPS